MVIDVPDSEVIDRITILQIKLERLADGLPPEHLEMMKEELECLLEQLPSIEVQMDSNMFRRLRQTNEFLWDAIEEQNNAIRYEDDEALCVASKKVVRLNNSRFELKCAIDEMVGSYMREFKQ